MQSSTGRIHLQYLITCADGRRLAIHFRRLKMNPHMLSHREAFLLNRRAFMYRLGYGLGGLAFTSLLAQQQARAGVLAAKKPMVPTKAKACIFLLMEGGPSHIDTFDPKPKLAELHMKEFVR